jgi:hypothetical protein
MSLEDLQFYRQLVEGYTVEQLYEVLQRNHGSMQRIAKAAGVRSSSVSMIFTRRLTSANILRHARLEVAVLLAAEAARREQEQSPSEDK